MTVPLHEISQRFTDAAFTAPFGEIFERDEVQQAGAQLQRLAQRLAPFLDSIGIYIFPVPEALITQG